MQQYTEKKENISNKIFKCKLIPSQSLPVHYNNMSTLPHLEPALKISISKEYIELLSYT